MRSSLLHGSETWPVRKETQMALQRAEMRTSRRICGVKVNWRVSNEELRETRNRGYNIGTSAKQVTMVCAFVAKGG